MTSIRSVPLSLAACILMLAACAVHGCGCNNPAQGILIRSKAEIKPDVLSLKQVDLRLAGSKFKADIQQSIVGNEVKIDLLSDGQLVESEIYLSTDEAFSVVDAGGGLYEPPIPILQYGAHVGDPPTAWEGKFRTGPVARQAKALVKTSTEGMSINGGIVPNVFKIEVELLIDSGRVGEPATRKLTFWIAPEMGVVKRAFGDYSLRTPMED